MSTNGNYGWKPRKTATITLPSGQIVTVRRPGPEFTLRSTRVVSTFTRKTEGQDAKRKAGESLEDYYQRVLREMSDEELGNVTLLAKELVLAMMVSPKLVLNPDPNKDEIGPEDVPGGDFWALFDYGMTNFLGIKVPVGDGEVEVQDLKSFRAESGISGDGVDGVHIPSDVEQSAGDQGLVGSAGD